MILDVRDAAEADPALIEQSKALRSTPETRAIAREHLVACLACTLRNLPEQKAAALLLREVHGLTSSDVADLLEASPGQAKNSAAGGQALHDSALWCDLRADFQDRRVPPMHRTG